VAKKAQEDGDEVAKSGSGRSKRSSKKSKAGTGQASSRGKASVGKSRTEASSGGTQSRQKGAVGGKKRAAGGGAERSESAGAEAQAETAVGRQLKPFEAAYALLPEDEVRAKLLASLLDQSLSLSQDSLGTLVREAQVLGHAEQTRRERSQLQEAQEAVARQEPPPGQNAPGEVDIEQLDATSFAIQVGAARVFFTRDELRELARHCWATGDVSEGCKRIYRWLEQERRDFLMDTVVDRPLHPALARIYRIIRSRYRAGKGS